jgi:hypothetical protein
MRTPETDRTDGPSQPLTPDPAEGRDAMDLPGADRPAQPAPETDELPEQLGRRISEGPGSGIAAGEPDVLPDVEPPSETM